MRVRRRIRNYAIAESAMSHGDYVRELMNVANGVENKLR